MIKIGLVGLGFIGRTHLDAYEQIENGQVIAICTRKSIKDQEISSQYNVSFVEDYDDLLNNNAIDVIDICLPTYLHEETIIKAANAGKHIICEKPLTLSVESANRIMNEVNKNNVKLFVAHVLRFWPEYKMIKSYGEREKLDFDLVYAKRLGQVPAWSSWFQDPDKSGGALFDLHIHDIDYLYYLLGQVDSLYAVGHKNRYGAWDHVMTTLSFKNGCKAFVEASQRMPTGYPFTMSLRVQAEQGTIDFNLIAGKNIENIEDSQNQFVFYSKNEKKPILVDKSDAFRNELSYFLNCIEQNQENTVIPLDDVLYTLKLLRAIENSLDTGCVVRV